MKGSLQYVMAVMVMAVFLLPEPALAIESRDERKARLEAELSVLEGAILKQEVLVQNKKAERQSLERDVAVLDAQIDKAQLAIQARSVAIEQLGSQIDEREGAIAILEEKLDKQKVSLGELVRKTNEIDTFSLVEVLLSNQSFSTFFTDMESFQSLKVSLNESLAVLEEIKTETESERAALQVKQASEEDLRVLQELEKQDIEAREAEKDKILRITKGEEAAYQEYLEKQKKTASQIRQQLFELRDSTAIPFGEAYELAKTAGARAGVRPALIMGILTQETRLGSNLGVPGQATKDMHPDRDLPVFAVIADTLGFDPDSVPVSRAYKNGWGGAMGPSQFIPSTWAIFGGYVNSVTGRAKWGSGYTGTWTYNANADVIRGMLGKSSPSNPYNNQDAFLATALLMRDNGAGVGTYHAERLAALRYYAGWAGATKSANAFYGDQVMGHTERIQREIDIIEGR